MIKQDFDYKHLYLDRNSKIHILLPIASGDQISTNSTYQATKNLKGVFSLHNKNLMQKGSLQLSLEKLQKDLKNHQFPDHVKSKLTAQCQFLLHEIENLKSTETIKSLYKISTHNYFPSIYSFNTPSKV